MKRFFTFFFLFFLALSLCPFHAQAAYFSPVSFTLDNGMPFYVIPHAKGSTLYHGIFYRVGSLDDPKGKEGLAHFFEHMMFKGKDANLVYTLGGDENAYTTYHMTAYHQSFPKEQLRPILRREVRRMEKLPITEKEFFSEQSVILEERLQQHDNNPSALFYERARSLYFYGHPYASSVIGTKESIQNITLEDMQTFFEKHYVPQNAFSVVAGNIDPEEAFKAANATLGKVILKKGERNDRIENFPSSFYDVSLSASDERTHYPSSLIMMTAPTFSSSSLKEAAALALLLDYLTDGVNAYLQKSMVKEEKLLLSIGASYSATLPFGGMLSFSFTPQDKVSNSVIFDRFYELLSELLKKGISKDRFLIYKKRLLAGQIYLQDMPSEKLHAFANLLMTDLSLEEIEDIPAVYIGLSREDVLFALARLLRTPKLKGERLPK